MTLDSDTEQMIRRRMRRDKTSFKQALNDAIRDGCGTPSDTPFHTPTASMGRPRVNLDRALQLAAELEDDELMRRMNAGS